MLLRMMRSAGLSVRIRWFSEARYTSKRCPSLVSKLCRVLVPGPSLAMKCTESSSSHLQQLVAVCGSSRLNERSASALPTTNPKYTVKYLK